MPRGSWLGSGVEAGLWEGLGTPIKKAPRNVENVEQPEAESPRPTTDADGHWDLGLSRHKNSSNEGNSETEEPGVIGEPSEQEKIDEKTNHFGVGERAA
jgi:hypothetical protein